MRVLAEVGSRPNTLGGKIKEKLQGRTLIVPDQDGELKKVKGVTTLRRSIFGPRRRTIYEPSDYGPVGDLAFAEVDQSLDSVTVQMGRQNKIRRVKEISIPPYNTVATGFVIDQLGNHGKSPETSIIYSNTAPRGGEKLGAIEWLGNDGQDFVFGILKSGVPIFAVRAGSALSYVRNELVGLWRVNVPANGTQFRSRDNFPDALKILGGRRGRKYIGEWIDPATIPDKPQVVRDEVEGTVAFPVGYNDGYGNLKTGIRVSDLPSDLREAFTTKRELWVRETDAGTGEVRRLQVKNRLAGEEADTGELFFTVGSSGPKGDGYIEVNEMFGNSAQRMRTGRLTDTTTVVFESPLVREPVGTGVK